MSLQGRRARMSVATVPAFVRRISLMASIVSLALTVAATLPAPVSAAAPWWAIYSETAPTNLSPGDEGQLYIVVSNFGDAPINGSNEPVTITDELPSGLTATEMPGTNKNGVSVECSVTTLSCVYKGILNPYEQLAIPIKVKVEEPPGTASTLSHQASVEGGGASRCHGHSSSRQRPACGVRRRRLSKCRHSTRTARRPHRLAHTRSSSQQRSP